MKLKQQDKALGRKKEIESLLDYLEEEYRTAKISEDTYNELKEKNLKKLEKINKNLGKKKKKKQKVTKSEPEQEEPDEKKEPVKEVKPKEKIPAKKEGKKLKPPKKKKQRFSFLRRIFRRGSKKQEKEKSEVHEEPEFVDPLKGPPEKEVPDEPEFVDPLKGPPKQSEEKKDVKSGSTEVPISSDDATMELEKTKVLIGTLKERDKVTDERISQISEKLGELRSMVFQTDGSLREISLKLERIEDQLKNIAPKEIEKRFREKDSKMDKYDMSIDMLTQKVGRLTETVNRTNKIVQDIGGVENLASLNKRIKEKISEIKELVRYIERLSSKTEKYFMGMNKNMEDFLDYKVKIDNLGEVSKDLVRTVDGLNLKFEDYVTVKDLRSLNEDLLKIKEEIENFKEIAPIAEMKTPIYIKNLRQKRDDIQLLLDSIESQYENGRMTKKEYEHIKKNNLKKLETTEEELLKKWKKFQALASSGKVGKVETGEEPEEKLEKSKTPEKEPEKKTKKSKTKKASGKGKNYEKILSKTVSDAKKQIKKLKEPDYEKLMKLEKAKKDRKTMKEYLKTELETSGKKT